MLRSMYSGISGLRNFQTKLDVIGNNIANVSTAGFKKGRVTFKDAMSQMSAGASAATENRGGKNSMQVGLGSSLSTIDTIHTGSSLQTTNRPEDLAIQGDGYFVVKEDNAEYYTRAGNMYLDNNGTLVNGDGYKVQAYQVDDKGNVSSAYGNVTINVNALLPATTTSEITISGNLDPNTLEDEIFTQQIKVVDDKGKEHTIDVHYKKTSPPPTAPTAQTWDVYFNQDIDTIKAGTGTVTTKLSIDPAGVTTIATNPISIGPLPGATAASTITLDATDLTSTAGSGISIMSAPNGFTAGKLESFSVGAMGEINGVYSNGQVATLGRLAIAKFSNTSGLNKAGGNLFQETINSGVANIAAAGDGRGTIASGTLEMSNVDLSEEFTEMITAQRGFQANTRIITTSDEILQELVNLKR